MLRPVTVNLVLLDDEIEVSQAIPLGKHTGVSVNVTVHNCNPGGGAGDGPGVNEGRQRILDVTCRACGGVHL